MTSMNISLPEPMKEFVDDQVSKQGYSSVSEYLRDLIREAQRKSALEDLEQKILKGIASGKATPMTKSDWERMRAELNERFHSKET